MDKLGRIFSYLNVIIYSLFKNLTISPYRRKDTKKILVIMAQVGIGDAVSALDAFYNLSNHLELKYELYIATTPEIAHFLKETQSTFNARLIALELSKEVKLSFNIFKENQQKLSVFHWDYIISLNRIGFYLKLLLLGCSYKKIFGMEYIGQNISVIESLLMKRLNHYHCIYLPTFSHVVSVYRKVVIEALCEILANNSIPYFSYFIPILEKNPLEKIKGKYCIICPSIAIQKDHPFANRKWPIDRIISIVNHILESSELNICLCGVATDKEDNAYVIKHSKYPSRVINLTGKTSFKQWIELIRDAKFVFGNDSGYIHLAHFLGVPSFAIAGYWNYGRFLPYPEEENNKRGKVFDIRIPMVSCVGCAHRSEIDYDRLKCNQNIEKYGTYKCIWEINIEMVKKAINILL